MALYLFCLYMDEAAMERFTTAWQQTGKKLDMGKSCVRFKKLDQVALDVVADAIRAIPVKDFVAHYDASRPKKGKKEPNAQ
jgi:hypothetical protein